MVSVQMAIQKMLSLILHIVTPKVMTGLKVFQIAPPFPDPAGPASHLPPPASRQIPRLSALPFWKGRTVKD